MENSNAVGCEKIKSGNFSSDRGELMPVAAILAAVFLWGASFPAMRKAVGDLSPWAVMWVRMVIASVLLLPTAGKFVAGSYRKGDWKLLAAMALFQPCLYFLMESYALRFTTSSQAGIIAASLPLMVALGAWLVLSETITRHAVAGLILSIIGVACLTLLDAPGGAAENPLLGNFLELGAMASASANFLVIKQLSRRYNPWGLTAIQMTAGVVFFIPGLFFLLHADGSVWTLQMILILIFLGGFVTVGAFGLYNWGMSRIPAARASVFINLIPVVAVALGWSLLGEGLTAFQCVAASAVIGGVWLGQRS